MNGSSVVFREVAIHRVPGIRRNEGFRLDDLSPGVNILFGPNGAGKSTTCRVLLELLWPGRLPRPTVEAIIADGDAEWHVDIDAGRVQSTRNGRAAVPDFGPAENRLRYHLGLRQFIVDQNEEFACKIVEASQGGYDLETASAALNYSARPTGPRALSEQLRQREQDVQEAQQAERRVAQAAGTLADLRRQRRLATEAEIELERLHHANAYREAVEHCLELQAERDAFPEGVARLRGDEVSRLKELAEKEERLTDQLAAERERHRRSETELKELALPEEGLPEDLIRLLRARKEELRAVEGSISQQRQRLDEAEGKADQALALLGDAVTVEQLAALSSIEQPDVSAFARKATRVRAERAALEERRRWLAADTSEEIEHLDHSTLQNGIHALAHWLSEPGPESGPTPPILVAAALLLLVLTAALGTLQLWIWMAAAAAACLLVAAELWSRRPGDPSTSARGAHRRAYEGLPLPPPASWNADGIAAHLRELTQLSGRKALALERQSRLTALLDSEEALTQAELDLERRRIELAERLACRIDLNDEWLPLLVDRITTWQSAVESTSAAETALAGLQDERSDLLEAIQTALHPFRFEHVGTAAAAEECVAELERRRQRHVAAEENQREASRQIEDVIKPQLEDLAQERSALLEPLGIDADRTALITDWMAQRDAYLDCAQQLEQATTLRDDKRKVLEPNEELLELDAGALQRRIDDAAKAAGRRDEIIRDIGDIEGRIREAKTGHTLENALAARDAARLALAEARRENGRLRTGATLTDWVRQVAVDRARPHVFQRADELFVRFTRGTLQLQMDDRSTPPAFLARRGKRPPQHLEELSDGERVQLMAAVRLAFLEHSESKAVPLLIDEVLGTSDDDRSEVMIDTIIDVARQGRQVFYCTAQHDEVGKWVARLRQAQINFKLHDLARIRELAAAHTHPLEIVPVEKSVPPAPGGHTYESYGRELGVPGIDPRAETIDQVHLWHLLNDADLLFRLLCKEISTWGQLETLLDHHGAGLIDADDGAFDAPRAAARALEAACHAWRLGRGKPVDRSALMDSGCVSDTFMDRVAELAARSHGRAASVIEGLERGDVSGFYSSKTERLREYFEEEGYLAHEEPLEPEDIRIHAAAAAAEYGGAAGTEAVVSRLVAAVVTATPSRGAEPE